MLLRQDSDGLIMVAQPAHAWISGQLACGWGSERFGALEPHREVCAAAEQHDIAWLAWEAEPRLNPDTGLPYTFRDMPTTMHLSVWEPAGQLALSYGRYAALLVSMHGTYLYQRFHDYERDTDEEAAAARAFLQDGKRFQEMLVEALREDASYRSAASDEVIQRNRRLVSLWDGMSLALCEGFENERRFEGVPTTGGSTSLILRRDGASSRSFIVDPWPFRDDEIFAGCDARKIRGRFADESAMRAAIAGAPWVRLEFALRPA